MPMYAYRCGKCGTCFNEFHKMVDCLDPTYCDCGGLAVKQLSAPRIVSDYAGYSCPVTGNWIEGRKAHQENLKRTESRVLETGEREGAERNRAAGEASFDRAVDETVERQVEALPSASREKLYNELASGIDAKVIRN